MKSSRIVLLVCILAGNFYNSTWANIPFRDHCYANETVAADFILENDSVEFTDDSGKALTGNRTTILKSTREIEGSNYTWEEYLIGGAAITGLLFATDQQTYNGIEDIKEDNFNIQKTSPIITQGGDGRTSLFLFGSMSLYGYILGDQKAKRAGIVGIESFLASGAVVQIIKHLVGRERPSVATRTGGAFHGPFLFLNGGGKNAKGLASFDSFPSGHTATAFAAASTLSDMYPEWYISSTVYSLASVIALSRIMEETHWASDCFVGAVLGVAGTKLVEKLGFFSQQTLNVVPYMSRDSYGMQVSFGF
jgi:membrane-associated phospholipid phosphatase